MTTLYGIKNCDTIRKARRWLQENGIDYRFHDVREDGISEALLNSWMKTIDWELLLNRRSSTWRQLPDPVREHLDRNSAMDIMLEHPTIIKRPLLEHHQQLHLGFNAGQYAAIFQPDTTV
jgi:arsenate reductase